jgi:hypothetical protein
MEISFPESWIGSWEGPLIINSGKTPYDTILMNFKVDTITGTDSILWQLQYGEQSMRDYRLVPKTNSTGDYLLDEQNSILIDAKLFDQKLVSFFEVQNSALTAIYEFIDGNITFEILMYDNENNITISGNSIHNGEEIPTVKSYLPKVYQKAVLSKKSDSK